MAYPQPHTTWDPTQNINLKPIPYAAASPAPSEYSQGYYKPVAPSPQLDAETEYLRTQDSKIKKRIRNLRIVSRTLAVLLSGATLAPITMTLVKFFQTRNEYMVVDGEERTAWASGTIAWYTYMYFGISLVSFILNFIILVSYCCGVKNANKAAKIATWWNGVVLGAHVVVWAISVAIYRYGREPVDGRFVDLWGWTCSEAANAIQSQITNINFEQYCSIQVCMLQMSSFVPSLTKCIDDFFLYRNCQHRRRYSQCDNIHLRHRAHALEEEARESQFEGGLRERTSSLLALVFNSYIRQALAMLGCTHDLSKSNPNVAVQRLLFIQEWQ
jgi:hypothetical protein